jgi:hypothetical protein
MKKLMLPLMVFCFIAPSAVFAAHPLTGDTAETVETKKFEAETAMEYSMNKNAGVKVKTFVMSETVTGGVVQNVEAFVSIPYQSIKEDGLGRQSGFSDATIGAKWNFATIDKLALAVKSSVSFPTGDDEKGLGSGKMGVGVALIASEEINHLFSVDGNLILKYQGVKAGDSYYEFGLSAAGKYNVTPELKGVGEVTYSKTDESGSKAVVVLTTGAVYAVQKNLDIDGGVRFGLTKEAEDFAVLAGITLKF